MDAASTHPTNIAAPAAAAQGQGPYGTTAAGTPKIRALLDRRTQRVLENWIIAEYARFTERRASAEEIAWEWNNGHPHSTITATVIRSTFRVLDLESTTPKGRPGPRPSPNGASARLDALEDAVRTLYTQLGQPIPPALLPIDDDDHAQEEA